MWEKGGVPEGVLDGAPRGLLLKPVGGNRVSDCNDLGVVTPPDSVPHRVWGASAFGAQIVDEVSQALGFVKRHEGPTDNRFVRSTVGCIQFLVCFELGHDVIDCHSSATERRVDGCHTFAFADFHCTEGGGLQKSGNKGWRCARQHYLVAAVVDQHKRGRHLPAHPM